MLSLFHVTENRESTKLQIMLYKRQTYPLQIPMYLPVAISVAYARKSSERWNLSSFAAMAAWTIEAHPPNAGVIASIHMYLVEELASCRVILPHQG